MANNSIYISLKQSTVINRKDVYLEDIATIFCPDNKAAENLKAIKIYTFDDARTQIVITIMKIIEQITAIDASLNVVSLGSSETIMYYKNKAYKKPLPEHLKAVLLMLIAFFGTSYSIMSYNGDVGARELLDDLFSIFTGSTSKLHPTASILGLIFYSIGLSVGMIIFFNHGLNKNSAYDPTPLQVQMRMYEQDVNSCIIIDSERKNRTIDAD